MHTQNWTKWQIYEIKPKQFLNFTQKTFFYDGILNLFLSLINIFLLIYLFSRPDAAFCSVWKEIIWRNTNMSYCVILVNSLTLLNIPDASVYTCERVKS